MATTLTCVAILTDAAAIRLGAGVADGAEIEAAVLPASAGGSSSRQQHSAQQQHAHGDAMALLAEALDVVEAAAEAEGRRRAAGGNDGAATERLAALVETRQQVLRFLISTCLRTGSYQAALSYVRAFAEIAVPNAAEGGSSGNGGTGSGAAEAEAGLPLDVLLLSVQAHVKLGRVVEAAALVAARVQPHPACTPAAMKVGRAVVCSWGRQDTSLPRVRVPEHGPPRDLRAPGFNLILAGRLFPASRQRPPCPAFHQHAAPHLLPASMPGALPRRAGCHGRARWGASRCISARRRRVGRGGRGGASSAGVIGPVCSRGRVKWVMQGVRIFINMVTDPAAGTQRHACLQLPFPLHTQGSTAEQMLLSLLAVDEVVAAVCNTSISSQSGAGASGGAGPRGSPRVRVYGMLYARAAAAFQQVMCWNHTGILLPQQLILTARVRATRA